MKSTRTRWTLTRDPAVRRTIKIAVDFSCGVLAVLIGFAVQLGRGSPNALQIILTSALAGAIVAAVNAIGISYRTTWRYVGVKEPLVFMGCSAAVFLTLGALALFRVGCRSRWRRSWSRRCSRRCSAAPRGQLAVGASVCFAVAAVNRPLQSTVRSATGIACSSLARGQVGFEVGQQLRDRRLGHVELIGFLDDDRTKLGTLMDGVPVLGPVEQMLSIAERYNATEVIIAMPSAPSEFVRALVRRAEDIGLRARAVGDVGRLLTNGDNHRPGTINLRELSTEQVVDWPATGRPSARGARRVLVTGGAGFIGSHLTRMLLDRNYHVRVLDNFTYGYAGLSAIRTHPRLEIVAGDICNLRDVSRAMRDVEGVIGLAAIVGDPACNLDPEETINLNYAATQILAECADFYRVQRLVFASSCSVYGASLKEDDLLNERSRLNPVSLYARTRVLSENIIFDRCGDTEPVVSASRRCSVSCCGCASTSS